MQTDGNLVLYNRWNNQSKWRSNTRGTTADTMYFAQSGNLYVQESGRGVIASLHFSDCAADRVPVIALQNDSNLVIYCHKTGSYSGAIWATHTVF